MTAWAEQPQRFSVRYGARNPWLAPRPRAALYLVWRGLVAGFRPALFLSLLAASVVFAGLAAQILPRPSAPPPSLSLAIDRALFEAVPADADRHAYWVDVLEASLQVERRTMPDIAQARAVASAYMAMRGREALALELLADGRRRSHVEAELRAQPAWIRERRLREAVEVRLEAGRAQGLEPETLIFAPRVLRVRLQRADALFGPALSDAEAWFVAPGDRALALDALPGLTPRTARLYGDLRGLVVRGCALGALMNRPTGQCRIGFLPKPQADPVLAGLSLAVAGAAPERRSGARIIKAAWAAGLLDASLAEEISFGPDPVLGREAVLASAMPVLAQAGEAWTQPARFDTASARVAQEAGRAARINTRERDRLFDAFTALRREVGALSAMRLADTVRDIEDAEELARLAQAADGRLLALHAFKGPELLAVLDAGEAQEVERWDVWAWPRRAQHFAALSLAALLAALGVLGLSLYHGRKRRRGGSPGMFERIDAAMSRLTLGRNL